MPETIIRPAAHAARHSGSVVSLTLAGLLAVTLTLVPALWNGFPILFPDTGGYLARPINGTLELGRSALYGALLAAGLPSKFWLNVIAQAALVVWLIALTLRSHGLDRPAILLGLVAVLAVATGMPWYAGTLMPDILLPAAVLALYLLTFRAETCGPFTRAGLIATITIAIASHMGTLAVCMALVICLALLKLLRLRPFDRLPQIRLKLAGAAVAGGIALALVSNFAIAGKFAFTPGGESFLFGRLVQDGIVARYLEDRCPDPGIALCPYRNDLPATAEEWLWAPGNPIGELGGWRGYASESRRIILDTLRMYPLQHAIEATTTTLEQLGAFKTEVSLTRAWTEPTLTALSELTPELMPDILAARQQAAPYPALIAALNLIHVPVAALSLATLVGLILLARWHPVAPDILALATMVLLTVLINAAVCGIFSNPVDRYQSRLVWLAPLTVMIAVMVAARARRRRAVEATRNRLEKAPGKEAARGTVVALIPPHPRG
jgi:hypothetical protein